MAGPVYNFTGTGAFQEVVVPRGSLSMRIQARNAVAIQIRYKNSPDYFTLKAGDHINISGQLSNIEVNAANDEVVEFLFGTSSFGGFS